MAGAVGGVGFAGCTDGSQSEPRDGIPSFDFAGVIVESLPGAEQYQPLDVTVSIEKDGTERYHETHTVEDIVSGVAFTVTEEWMDERVPYAATVSSPVHDPKTYTTTRLDEEDKRGQFGDKSVYFRFQLTSDVILFRPAPD